MQRGFDWRFHIEIFSKIMTMFHGRPGGNGSVMMCGVSNAVKPGVRWLPVREAWIYIIDTSHVMDAYQAVIQVQSQACQPS